MRRWDAADGLPSDVVTSIAAGATGTWVGTTMGLAFVDDSPRPVGPRVAIRDLLLWKDTLWIASDAGVLALSAQDSVPRRLAVDDARVNLAVAALARADSVLAVATDFELIEIDLNAQQVLPPRPAARLDLVRSRPIRRAAMDAQTIWLAGEGGVTVVHRATGQSTHWMPVLVPAPATSVALARDLAWLGTREGLVRMRRRADGMPP